MDDETQGCDMKALKAFSKNLLFATLGMVVTAQAALAGVDYKCMNQQGKIAAIRLENKNSILRLTVVDQSSTTPPVVDIGYENVKLLVGETRPALGTTETIADKNNKYELRLSTEENPKNPKAATRLSFNVVDKESARSVAYLRFCKLGR
jgi:hypothetical protein